MNIKEMSNEDLLRYDYNETDYPEIFAELLSRLEQAENLKCCGNCSNWYSEMRCPNFGEGQYESNYCDKWDSDKLTRRDRII